MHLLDYLAKQFPQAKKTTLRQMVQEGRVHINGRPAGSVKREVGDSDQVRVLARPERVMASIAPLRIVHEDQDILVVNKPSGLLTSTTPREPRKTAIAIIRAYLADSDPTALPGVIHRLDREASGLLVFSKNRDTFANLKRQFFHHTATRVYSAVVNGHFLEKAGRIESLLVEYADGTVHSTTHRMKGQEAVTDYEVVAERNEPPRSLLRVTLKTGRKHQIRVHLACKGHAIVGDEVYGGSDGATKRRSDEARGPLLLCATLLEFDHPRTGHRMRFELPLPEEIRVAVDIANPSPVVR